MEIYWEQALLVILMFVVAFVCWIGDRESKRIDAIEGQLNLMRKESERAKHQTWDDGR